MSPRPYLFPVPGRVLRDLLDVKADLGEPFSDDEAAADLMLDLDLVEHYGREPQPTGMLHAVRYYAERWGWPKSRVAEAWSGRRERARSDGRVVAGADPWIADRVGAWRAFFQDLPPDSARRAPDNRRTKSGDSSQRGGGAGHAPDSARRAPDKQEQTPDLQRLEERPRARAREALVALGFSDPALVAEAEDAAAGAGGALRGDDLVRAALCLGLSGAVPHPARPVLDDLDGPASAALLVAVLRTGDTPRTGPRTNYLLSLARSLDDHDRASAYALAHPEAAGPDPRRGPGGAGGVRGAAGPSADVGRDGARLSAAERRGQFGPQRARQLADAALALGAGDPGDGGAGDGE